MKRLISILRLTRAASWSVRGFTLLELLVTLSLMTIVFAALVSIFSGSARVWQRVRCGVQQNHEIYFAQEDIKRELRAYHPFKPIAVKLSSEELEFPALIPISEENEEHIVMREPARIGYYFDRNRQSLCRSQTFYRGTRWQRMRDQCQPIAQNIEAVRFDYLSYHESSKSFVWSSSTPNGDFPVALKMELQYRDPCTDDKHKTQFTIAIPVGPIR